MFSQLPEPVKQQVIKYLQANNFPAAKRLHDEWLRNNNPLQMKNSTNKHKDKT